jgi:hypothetical protein
MRLILFSAPAVLCGLCLLAALLITFPCDSLAQVPSRSGRFSQSSGGNWRTAPRESAEDDGVLPDNTPQTPATRWERPRRSASDRTRAERQSTAGVSTEHDPFESRFVPTGQVWRDYDLAPYTARIVETAHSERAVVEWIIKQTGLETWHGGELAVLAATRGRLRVFHTPELQTQVAEIVDRFVRPVQSQVAMRMQFVAATDLDWRSGLVHLLEPLATGSDGQQIWLIAPEDAALLRERLRLDRPGREPLEHRLVTHNGQTATVQTGQPVNYISGVELTTGARAAYRPLISRIAEGVTLSVTPLWTADGSAVDVELKLVTRAVNRLHSTETVSPLSTGKQRTMTQVPQAAGSTLDRTLRWPTSRVLLISAGVQPGVLGKRTGLSFSASAPELLLLAELDRPTSTQARRGRLTAER